jgi:DNA ligase-1
MDFAAFADRVDAIEAETADLEITSAVADLFVDAGDDLPVVVRLLLGRVVPAWDSTTLDVGPRLCHEALARAAGPNVTADDVADRLAETGEIGAVAESLDLDGQRGLAAFGTADTDPLTVADVDSQLRDLAAADGAGSHDRKVEALFGLFNRADPLAARYLARLVLSEMRIGVGDGTVRDAIAEAFDVPVADVERALQVTNDAGAVAVRARDEGVEGLADAELRVGRPVSAMLAQAGTAVDALDAWDSVAVETKFDGARVQVHHDPDGETRVFSRNLEDVTDALPELVEFVADLDVPAILDGEALAVDDAGGPLPFQEVLRRFRRKYDVERMREEVTVEFRAFDCLHVDGTDLLDAPLLDRRAHLSDVLPAGPSPLTVVDDADAIADREATALDAGHEGIMLKDPDSYYTPGKRGRNWLKRKPDVETLDLVVTGAEWGEGRRANHLGTFLLSARVADADGDDFATIGKVATGITDEQLADLTDRFEPSIREREGTTVDIDPDVVFEVGYEEIQASPTYGSGYALRFPRFVAVREDKGPEDADSLARIERLAE